MCKLGVLNPNVKLAEIIEIISPSMTYPMFIMICDH